jgi:diguanylate cyclase (GGDEF)-like protein
VARLGGDEFALIMEEAGQTPQQGLQLCEQLCGELARPYALDHEGCAVRVELGASVGLALYPLHAQEADGLILAADRAMYGAKRNGKNRCVLAEAGR